jgi:glutathione S-transferase
MSLLGSTTGSNKDMSNPYAFKFTCYGQKLSFFTQKLLSALKWYDLEVHNNDNTTTTINTNNRYFPDTHEYKNKSGANGKMLESRSGTHQIPILETPEGWIVNDSTPILLHLDTRLETSMLYPGTPFTKCVVALIEEYFDEWMARLTIHTRWYDDDTARYVARELIKGSSATQVSEDVLNTIVNSKASPIIWGRKAIRALGMTSLTQRMEGEKELVRIYTELETTLRTRKYVMGNFPCAVDAALMGGLVAHFLNDPYPKKLLSSLSRVKAYASRRFPVMFSNQTSYSSSITSELPPFFEFVLREMSSNGYIDFVKNNRDAIFKKQKAFIATVYQERVSYLARPYVEKSRRMLQHHTATFLRNAPHDRKRYIQLLEKYNLRELYEPQLYAVQQQLSKI